MHKDANSQPARKVSLIVQAPYMKTVVVAHTQTGEPDAAVTAKRQNW